MTSQGTAPGRFERAVKQGKLFTAELAAREGARPSRGQRVIPQPGLRVGLRSWLVLDRGVAGTRRDP